MSDDEGTGYQRGNKRVRRGDSGMGDNDGPEPGVLYLKLLVPHLAVGSIIGKGGEAIIDLQKRVGARCRMSKPDDLYPGTANERICMLTGPQEGVVELVKYIHRKTVEKPDPNPKPDAQGRTNNNRHKQVKFVVPNTTAGMIIGKGGSHIKEISDMCGVKAIVSSKSESADGGQERTSERIVTVEGDNEDGVDRACDMVVQKISEDPNHMSNQDISHWNSGGGGQLSASQSGPRGGRDGGRGDHQMNGNAGNQQMNGGPNASMLSGMMGMPMQGLMQGMNPFGPRGPGMMPPGMPGMMPGMGMPHNADPTAAMMAAGYGGMQGMLAAFGGAGAAGSNMEQLAAAAAAQQQQERMQQQQQQQQHGLQPLLQDKGGMMDTDLRQQLAFADGGAGGGSLSALGASLGINMSGHNASGAGQGGLTIGGMNLPRSAAASLEKLRGLLDASRYAPVAQDEIIQALLILAKHNLLPGIGQNNEMITNLLVSLSAVGSLHDIVANLQTNGTANGNGSLNSSMNAGATGNSGAAAAMGLNESAAAAIAAAANGMFGPPPGAMGGMANMAGMAGLLNGNANGMAMGNMGGSMGDGSEMKREMYVEDSLVGVVLGPGGKGLREIGRASGGARVSVGGRDGTSDRRLVTVAGTMSQVERGVRFVEELVETERRRRARMAHKRKA